MIPYAIIKEVNPDNVKGSATGAINFLVFAISALTAPAYGWLLTDLSSGGKLTPAASAARMAPAVSVTVKRLLPARSVTGRTGGWRGPLPGLAHPPTAIMSAIPAGSHERIPRARRATI